MDGRIGTRRGIGAALVLVTGMAWGGGTAMAGELGRRCETRVEPRAIFGRNYVLDRVTVCERIDRSPAPRVDARAALRPAPPIGWGEPVEVEASRVEWDAERQTLRNAQYDRSLRALRGTFPRRVR